MGSTVPLGTVPLVDSTSRIFADDTKIYRQITSVEDPRTLQRDINNLDQWAKTWQLPFNDNKCHVLHLRRTNPYHAYLMDGNQLGQVDQDKDLGVLIDRQLKFHAHTAAACNKANQILAVVRKSFANLNEYVVPLLYKSLVRPHVEYGNSMILSGVRTTSLTNTPSRGSRGERRG